jgi:exodeoxyribonuclease VII large subunit
VQGAKAEGQIIKMLEIAETRKECDVLILARGGGSLEDLWVFNNENVARSVYKCTIPIVTGIGHEIDFTIADFVADERAATPSAAAELVSPDQIQIKQQLTTQNEKLLQLISNHIKQHQQYILQLGKRLPHPANQLQTLIQRIDHLQQRMSHSTYVTINTNKIRLSELVATLSHYNPTQSLQLYSGRFAQTHERLKQAIQYKLQQLNSELSNLSRTLDAVSPLASLNRGYAIVNKLENNKLVRDARQLSIGDTILTRFARGQTQSTVNKIIKK